MAHMPSEGYVFYDSTLQPFAYNPETYVWSCYHIKTYKDILRGINR
jgi:hypothetical protein